MKIWLGIDLAKPNTDDYSAIAVLIGDTIVEASTFTKDEMKVIVNAIDLINTKGYKLHSSSQYYQLLEPKGQPTVLMGTPREKGFHHFLQEVWRRYGLQQE